MENLYQQIIKKWTKSDSFTQQVIDIFEKVRDIPYGSIASRQGIDVYNNNQGTCSGKHQLLKALYLEMGIPVKDFIILHNFNNLPAAFPVNIQQIFKEQTVTDPHNFIKIKINDKWIAVDATWDIGLKKLGFPINENWNGTSDMEISVSLGGEIFETDNPLYLKEQLIKNLSNDVVTARKLFLKECTQWLNNLRKGV